MLLPIVGVDVGRAAVKIPILPYDGRGGFHRYQRLWLENVAAAAALDVGVTQTPLSIVHSWFSIQVFISG